MKNNPLRIQGNSEARDQGTGKREVAEDPTRLGPRPGEQSLMRIICVTQTFPPVFFFRRATFLKIRQIMHEKTLVIRDESNRAQVYAPANSETFTQSSLLKDLATKAFGGSTSKLVMRALDESTSKEEIADIRQLLNDLEK